MICCEKKNEQKRTEHYIVFQDNKNTPTKIHTQRATNCLQLTVVRFWIVAKSVWVVIFLLCKTIYQAEVYKQSDTNYERARFKVMSPADGGRQTLAAL